MDLLLISIYSIYYLCDDLRIYLYFDFLYGFHILIYEWFLYYIFYICVDLCIDLDLDLWMIFILDILYICWFMYWFLSWFHILVYDWFLLYDRSRSKLFPSLYLLCCLFQDDLCRVFPQHLPLWGAVLQPADPEARVGAVPGEVPGRGERMGYPYQRTPESRTVYHWISGRSC